jgi:glycosyltransferase involved in cell wall biosynthesis
MLLWLILSKQHIKDLITLYNLNHKIKVNDFSTDIDWIWENHHILVLPSVAEGTPLSLVECMLKGRPALTTDVGDCDRLVIDNVTGFLCPVSSPKYLKEKLLELFNTPMEQLYTMGDNAFDKARTTINLHSHEVVLFDLVNTNSEQNIKI